MSDDHPPKDETPMQKALRLKQAAQASRGQPARAGKAVRRQDAGMGAGKSKPWMTS